MFNIESLWQWMALLALLTGSVVKLAFHFFPNMTKRRRGTLSPPPARRCGGCCGCEQGQESPPLITRVSTVKIERPPKSVGDPL